MNPEKNDVNVSRLFNWGKVFILENGEEEILIYMRILGDADLNKARVYALRESAKLRKKLKDPNSDEHLISIRDKGELTKEDLVNYNVLFSARDITQTIWKSTTVPYPKQPKSDASLEEQEKYQEEIDNYPKKKANIVRDAIKEEEKKLRKDLNEMNKNELYRLYLESIVKELCEQVSLKAFNEMSTYLGCYKDNEYKEHFFKSFDEFNNIETEQKLEFMAAYKSLEMSTEETKKLREATP